MGALEFYEGKRESYWIYRIDLPPEPGKPRRQKKVVRDPKTGKRWTSKRACREAMQNHEVELRTGVRVQAIQQSMSSYMEQWLSDVSNRLAVSTVRNYRDCWQRVAPQLGAIELQTLQALAIQQVIRDLESRYAPDTIRLTHTVLHAALKQAVQWGLIIRNPADGIVLPASAPFRTKNVWTVAETQRFLAATASDPLHVLWRLLLDTGMRIGEALALGWEHVNLDSAPPRIRIERTITRSEDTWFVKNAPKTRRSRRTLSIQTETVEALRSWQVAQEERRRECGDLWYESGLVFDRGDGALLPHYQVDRRLTQACAAAGVPRRTPHELRHTFTTLAVQRGVPLKLIADRLGHTNIGLIAELYGHATEEGDQLVSDALRSVLNPPSLPFESALCPNDEDSDENLSNQAEKEAK